MEKWCLQEQHVGPVEHPPTLGMIPTESTRALWAMLSNGFFF